VALPVGQGPPTPAAVARVLLDRVVAYYTDHADPDDTDAPVPLPARRYVAGGEPRAVAWDLDAGQVHVAYERVMTGHDPVSGIPPSARLPRASPANRANLARMAAFEVQIVRPAPALGQLRTLPTTDQLDRHGHAIGLDLAHIARAVTEAARDGYLTRANVGEAPILIGDTVTLGPSGKVAAVAQALTIPLL
jgi:hypothetical protein